MIAEFWEVIFPLMNSELAASVTALMEVALDWQNSGKSNLLELKNELETFQTRWVEINEKPHEIKTLLEYLNKEISVNN